MIHPVSMPVRNPVNRGWPQYICPTTFANIANSVENGLLQVCTDLRGNLAVLVHVAIDCSVELELVLDSDKIIVSPFICSTVNCT